jgi:hypothetical protein
MSADTKLTSVNILTGVYRKFKIETIEGSMNLQKLVNRSIDLYNNNDEFKKLVDNHSGLATSGSKF